jgi:RNA polymerase sigma-70 factor (ECF subfamily)
VITDGAGARLGEDAESFDAFYTAHYRRVLAFAASLCRDRHAAEDLTQEAFVAAQRRWARLQTFDRPDAWVRRVVANRSVSRWRRLESDRHRNERLTQLAPRDSAEPPASDVDLWRRVSALPPRQAQVIALTYLEDRAPADVAEILGIGIESVKTHLKRGRAALAKALGQDED